MRRLLVALILVAYGAAGTAAWMPTPQSAQATPWPHVEHVRHLRHIQPTYRELMAELKAATEPLPIREAKAAPTPPSTATPAHVVSIGKGGPCLDITDVVAVITCAANYRGVSSSDMLGIAERESGLQPWETSPTGCCHGLFQLHEDYWAEWVARYTEPSWFPGSPSVFDPRANALVAAGMWAAQGGPCPAWCKA